MSSSRELKALESIQMNSYAECMQLSLLSLLSLTINGDVSTVNQWQQRFSRSMSTITLLTFIEVLTLDQEDYQDPLWGGKDSALWHEPLRNLPFVKKLRYGGLFTGVTPIPLSLTWVLTTSVYRRSAFIVLNEIVVSVMITFALNALMSIRVLAMYERTRKVLILLSVCFAMVQAVNIIASLYLAADMSIIDEGGCSFNFGIVSEVLTSVSAFAASAFEVLLFVMAVFRFIRDIKEGYKERLGNFDTLASVLFRDNAIYFVASFLTFSFSAISYIAVDTPAVVDTWAWFIADFIGALLGTIQVTILGPLMIISIRQYNTDKNGSRGRGTANADETLQFAAAPSHHAETTQEA
ncbi:hypothetical protein CONPUDRAFT_147938 [Coniophora puteana RWD-64-598 SS2]|uniref:Uncharacterized protein n=1 Tax=Coniophora puteana (strain RWD-64-598) TaxID=741705 RepID=R7SE84_CONPW|nr:uncharacterized protein CONPUDRAFT_147938 [Coniophora puteana RWD-64-598 SS2]EIW74057.1 hypothetical protein CONPUDRAFT_147938 [Coniophora puteana RWD-64-598 SS2]